MEELFSSSQVIGINSLRLQRKSNPIAEDSQSPVRRDDYNYTNAPLNPIPERLGGIERILPESYLKMLSSIAGPGSNTDGVPKASDFEGHSYHSGASLPQDEEKEVSQEDSVNRTVSTSGEFQEFDEDFLNKEEAEWKQRNPLAQFDFMTEPQADWAKQIIHSPHAFNNVLKVGTHTISPRAFFYRKSPPFSELKTMLSEMTYENVYLPDQNSQTFTHIAGRTHQSEPFNYDPVSTLDLQDAVKYGDQVEPVRQEVIDFVKEQKVERLQRMDEDASDSEKSGNSGNSGNSEKSERNGDVTIPIEPVEMDGVRERKQVIRAAGQPSIQQTFMKSQALRTPSSQQPQQPSILQQPSIPQQQPARQPAIPQQPSIPSTQPPPVQQPPAIPQQPSIPQQQPPPVQQQPSTQQPPVQPPLARQPSIQQQPPVQQPPVQQPSTQPPPPIAQQPARTPPIAQQPVEPIAPVSPLQMPFKQPAERIQPIPLDSTVSPFLPTSQDKLATLNTHNTHETNETNETHGNSGNSGNSGTNGGPIDLTTLRESVDTSRFPIAIDLTNLENNVPSLANPNLGDPFIPPSSNEPPSMIINDSLYEPPQIQIPVSQPNKEHKEAESDENKEEIGRNETPLHDPSPPIRDHIDNNGPILTSFLDESTLLNQAIPAEEPFYPAVSHPDPIDVETAVYGSLLRSPGSDPLEYLSSISNDPIPDITFINETPYETPKIVSMAAKVAAEPPKQVPKNPPKTDFGGIQLKADRINSRGNSPIETPILSTSSPVLSFGCVDINFSRHSSLTLRNVSSETLLFSLHLHSLQNSTAPSPFRLETSPKVSLSPAETATVIVTYQPTSVQEDDGLIIIEPLNVSHEKYTIPLVGFGGKSQPEIRTRGDELLVTNHGDRTACFFVMAVNQRVVSLVKNSTFLPPIFYLPSMMEFTIKLADLRSEVRRNKIPESLYIYACDNILRRRLLQAQNRNSLLRCPSIRHQLLLYLTECSSETSATTRTLLFSKTLSASKIDISRDLEDEENLCDLDTLLGVEESGKSHYNDLEALQESLFATTIQLNETVEKAGNLPRPSVNHMHRFEWGSENGSDFGSVQNRADFGGMQHMPRIHQHNYKCQFTDPYDQLEAQQKISEGVKIGSLGDKDVRISPLTVRVSLGSPEGMLWIFNNNSRNVDYYVSHVECLISKFPSIPPQISVSSQRGTIPLLSQKQIQIQLTTAGRHQLMREVSLPVLVDGNHHEVHVAIGYYDEEGPKIELLNSEGREMQWSPAVSPYLPPSREPVRPFVQPSFEPYVQDFGGIPNYQSRYQQPSGERMGAYQQPSREYMPMMQPSREQSRSVSVKSRETLRFMGCDELRSVVQIKDNEIVIPAGNGPSQLFKVVVYNHSNRKINLDLDRILPPFSCKYSNVVIEPKKKVRIPILYTPDGSMQQATCIVAAAVSILN